MILSHTHRYVYIGIPRTGSKSMNRWLMDHYDGEWVDHHHSWRVPAQAQDYLVFTIVRNPYERCVSGWYAVPWSVENPPPPKPASHFPGEIRRQIPLKDGEQVIPDHNVPEVGMNQAAYVRKAGVTLVLPFERLPGCLADLPFVEPDNMPPFPHREERGVRPPGNFFDHFTMKDEALHWEYAADDFAAFGYRRFDCGPPSTVSSIRTTC